MDLGLKDKVALVTGTGSQIGMGKAIALTLAAEGCDIISGDVDVEGAKKTADEVKALGRKAIAFKADVANSAEVGDMVKAALAELGKIDILVNTAGLVSGRGPFTRQPDEDWQKDIDVNFIGTINVTKAVLPGMLEHKYGKIVNFSSSVARSGMPNSVVYAAAKAAVIGFTKSLAVEVGPSGINVNALAPGMTVTNFAGGALQAPGRTDGFVASVPMRRVTTVQDIANLVAYLVSDTSSDITGQTISIDGGQVRL